MNNEPSRILLVEDNTADVYLFRKALESAALKFDLTVLRDGAEALAFVRSTGKYADSVVPDLVVLDLNLPKSGGIQVLRAIREEANFANVPVAVVSSSASPHDFAETEHIGVERYIIKPAGLDAFLQIGQIFKELLLTRHTSGDEALHPSGPTD
jgi:CheY-like chemotaxis protein